MNEIVAIIRPKRVTATKEALESLGFPSMTAISVLGRGKQKGIASELGIEVRPEIIEQGKTVGKKYMEYIPKRLLSIVACEEDTELIVKTIIKHNQSGQIGDGKIFVCPIEDAITVRTNEQGEKAIK
ncbi:P-II family nitrogen regulator [Anaerocolumna sp. AGMB13025]|uniref:P-II family nitrogen regulator n=1 Tax=Anaerocolumna sp. AGMB13025 TaxID=3039116 RepID=UPI00241BF61F|nr:P-II family nitrogen regulator [Anaerocolumna sp. AGMB13025]WFR58746.1 P-II family nitrogen regulator [Anaerocolumna sp. AGMB13025]